MHKKAVPGRFAFWRPRWLPRFPPAVCWLRRRRNPGARRAPASGCTWRSSAWAAGAATISASISTIRTPKSPTSSMPTRRSASGVPKRWASSRAARRSSSSDMREAFDDKSVNIVSIATPNHWHALAAIWAMQAGKDVYVEKPVSHNVSEGRRDGRDGPQAQPHLPGRHPVPLDAGHDRGHRVRQVRQDRRGEAGPRPVLQASRLDRPQGQLRRCRRRSTTTSGAARRGCCPDAAEVPLRLALAAGMGQRRHGQPGPAPDGHRPLGPGRRSPGRYARSPTAAGWATKTPATWPTPRSASSSSATRRWSSRSAAWRPMRCAAPRSA